MYEGKIEEKKRKEKRGNNRRKKKLEKEKESRRPFPLNPDLAKEGGGSRKIEREDKV